MVLVPTFFNFKIMNSDTLSKDKTVEELKAKISTLNERLEQMKLEIDEIAFSLHNMK